MNYKYIYISFFIFFISCDFNNDSIPVADINEDELKYKKFDLDKYASTLYNSINPIGESQLLYSGFLNDSSEIYSLFRIDKDIFNNYDLCENDSIKYNSIYMVIDLVKEYDINDSNFENSNGSNNFGDSPPILAYWINSTDINNSQNINFQNWEESDSLFFNDISINSLSSEKKLFLEKYQGKYYISLSDKIISESENNSSFNLLDLCDNQLEDRFIIVKNNPNLNSLFEFASSDYNSDFINTEPYLNIVYDEYELINKQSNKIMIQDDLNYQNEPNILFVSDSLSRNFNNIFVSNNFQQSNSEINDSLIWSDYNFDSSINFNNDSSIYFYLNTSLVNIENFQDSGITLWLDNIKYIEFINDPNEDNWSEEFTNRTENNNYWDAGEYLEDFGLDLCKDIYEDGQGGCLVDSTLSAYNNLGTENNNTWDDGEFYYDYGIDKCPDKYEDEIGGCLCFFPDSCINTDAICLDDNNDGICDNGFDPNLDNYNIDPSEDNWFDINLNNAWDQGEGMEGNNQWDSGEAYLDIGIDGLQHELSGFVDEGEGNNQYDVGEPFFDTGPDNLNNQDEPGWNDVGMQNNKSYQLGEIFEDCGTDNNCNDGNLIDDYITDPNMDNWNDCGSDNLCPNDLEYLNPDEDGTELNGQWDINEGTESNNLHDINLELDNLAEYYEDYGIDQLSDEEERLFSTQKINIATSDTVFFNIENQELSYLSSNTNDDLVKIAIESIEYLGSHIMINIKVNSSISILGLEFRINHSIYSNQEEDWVSKERNVAKIDSESYISDISLYNNFISQDSNSMYLNAGYGVLSMLKFDSLVTFLNNENIVINENNTRLKIYLDNNNSDFIIKSDQYIINFNEINDGNKINNLFSYYVQNSPDSLIIPIGSLIQKYINRESNYTNGLLIGLEENQYPPIFNFNNIILDSLKSPILEIFYFE